MFDHTSIWSQVISYVICLVVYIIAFVGISAFIVTAVQLGLDQMPDASSANITSFIAWFVFAIMLGVEFGYFMLQGYCLLVLYPLRGLIKHSSSSQLFPCL